MNLPFVIEVYVCKTDCILYDPIVGTEKVYAYTDGERETLILPSGTKLTVGCYRGGKPVVSREDLRKVENESPRCSNYY